MLLFNGLIFLLMSFFLTFIISFIHWIFFSFFLSFFYFSFHIFIHQILFHFLLLIILVFIHNLFELDYKIHQMMVLLLLDLLLFYFKFMVFNHVQYFFPINQNYHQKNHLYFRYLFIISFIILISFIFI